MTSVPVFQAKSLEDPSVRHGFFGRKGGVSTGLYASLNAGQGAGDDAAHVAGNRNRIARAMGITTEHLLGVYQTHSARAVYARAPWQDGPPKADALVTTTPGLALSILTADCAPVLFADPDAGVIGAAHAGWRGALDGILEASLDAMKHCGASIGNIRAAIGPCIAQPSYEVGPEFLQRFIKADAAHEHFFNRGNDDRWHFDLEGFCARRLRNEGVDKITLMALDTCARPGDFFSYRRATHAGESHYGRNLSAIVLCKT